MKSRKSFKCMLRYTRSSKTMVVVPIHFQLILAIVENNRLPWSSFISFQFNHMFMVPSSNFLITQYQNAIIRHFLISLWLLGTQSLHRKRSDRFWSETFNNFKNHSISLKCDIIKKFDLLASFIPSGSWKTTLTRHYRCGHRFFYKLLHWITFERLLKSLKHKTDEFNFGSRYYADENNYLREYNRNFTIKLGFFYHFRCIKYSCILQNTLKSQGLVWNLP